jgi:hypothetical protein
MTRIEELEAKRERLIHRKPPNFGIGSSMNMRVGEDRRKELEMIRLEILEAKLDLLLEKLAKVDF